MSNPSPASPPGPVIELRSVRLTYPGPPLVDAVGPCDLTLAEGDYVALMGRSGSGKTSLLNIVGLLRRPTGGEYFLSGIPTTALGDGERASLRSQLLGFVFQSFWLQPHRSALDNVAMGLLYRGSALGERRDAAYDALNQVGMSHRAEFSPRQLSGGEQQRVAIARALVGRPHVLLCDEPTGDLDSRTATEIMSVIAEQVERGVTVLLITHDEDVASCADRIVNLQDGAIAPAT